MTESFYDTNGMNDERFLILSDLTQEIPDSRLKITGRELRKNAQGKEYPVIMCHDKDGNKYVISAWKRDVRALIQEWGGEPLNWGYFEIHKAGNRFTLAVAKDQTPLEEDIRV